jgi:hypothetical protein
MGFPVKYRLLALFFLTLSNLVLAGDLPGQLPNVEQSLAIIKSQFPSPPTGFVWKLYKNVAFLKPEQWHEGEINTYISGIPYTTYAASPEEFSINKQFEMGVTVQLINNPQRIRGIEAKKMALVYIKPFLDTHKREEILILEQKTVGDFERTFFRYKDAPPGLKPIIVHKFILANNVTDNVNIITFESPADSWEENWAKYGTPILGKLNVLLNAPTN